MSPSAIFVTVILSGLIVGIAVIIFAPFGGWADFALAAAILVLDAISAMFLYRIMSANSTSRD